MDFGVENHNQEIIKLIKENYKSETNRRILSMPDFVVVDEYTKESCLVEVKYRTFKADFDTYNSNIFFKYGRMKSYLDFWKEATLILTLNKWPYCLCVDLAEVNWNVHFREKFENKMGKLDEAWNFGGIYSYIYERFPKVTKEILENNLHLLGVDMK
jgi:hypothetical protein